jgi:hypothetical protein
VGLLFREPFSKSRQPSNLQPQQLAFVDESVTATQLVARSFNKTMLLRICIAIDLSMIREPHNCDWLSTFLTLTLFQASIEEFLITVGVRSKTNARVPTGLAAHNIRTGSESQTVQSLFESTMVRLLVFLKQF